MQQRWHVFVLAIVVGWASPWAWARIPGAAAQDDGRGPAASVLKFEPATLTVDQGGTAWAKVTVALRSGKAGGTTLKAWDLPNGMTISFSPASGNPPFSTMMSVTVTPTSNAGTSMVKVQATGGGPSDVVSYAVTVNKIGGY